MTEITGSVATPVVVFGPDGDETPHWGPWTDDTTEAARAIGGYVVVIDSDPARILEDFRGQAPRDLRIEVTREDVSYYSETGDWLDGDRRVIRDHGTDVDTYGPDDADLAPILWAAERINRTDASQPSIDPLPDEISGREWLSGTYTDPYDNRLLTETSARLEGDWTPAERAEVFNRVTTVR